MWRESMKVLTIVGARPNFMKAAPLIAAIDRHNVRMSAEAPFRPGPVEGPIEHILVHTGQHYDNVMSGLFFADLDLPKPDVHLGVGSGSHAVQTAEVMKGFEDVLSVTQPDVVVVVGDVNSTLACALVAAKISFDSAGARPIVAHVEAGLRSFDRSMPEEINRIVTDHLADVLFVTEESGARNLEREGIAAEKVHFVGNTMIDSLLAFEDKAEMSTVREQLGLRGRPYALLTLHRPANVDTRGALVKILRGLEELARQYPIVFPVHPRTRRRLEEFGLAWTMTAAGLILTEPFGYLDFLCLMKQAALVVTDSGGIQEETTCLGIPCVTVRDNTERPVTVDSGTNVIAGTEAETIKEAIRRQIGRPPAGSVPLKWDGQAAERILKILIGAHEDRVAWRRLSISGACRTGRGADA
jgi:UDP-N-acetylglucosamine 2-epimerase (non-hydrolysing)